MFKLLQFNKSAYNLAIIAILTATFLLAIRGILVKQAILKNSSNGSIFFRFLITLPYYGYLLFIKTNSNIIKINKKTINQMYFSWFFWLLFSYIMDFYSLNLIDASINRIILYSFPIYVLGWNALIKKQISAKTYYYFFYYRN